MSVDALQSLQIILLLVVPVVCGSKVDFIYFFSKTLGRKICSMQEPF